MKKTGINPKESKSVTKKACQFFHQSFLNEHDLKAASADVVSVYYSKEKDAMKSFPFICGISA